MYISITFFQYSNFSHFLILGSPRPFLGGGWIPGPRKPQVGNNTPTLFIVVIFKVICTRNSQFILLLYSLVQNSANLCFFNLSDISGMLQGSLVHYMFLNSISRLLTLNPLTIIILESFGNLLLNRFVDC